MNKRALLLTAATAALLSGPALAQTQINSKVTTPQYTNVDGTITITTSGSIVITTNPPTAPALTINGSPTHGAADVINEGTISYIGVGSSTNPLTGIEMVTGNVGGLDSVGKIDFTGAGTNKTGILVSGTSAFLADITQTSNGTSLQSLFGSISSWKVPPLDNPNYAAVLLESSSTFKIQGDSSIGIDIASGATLGSLSKLSDIDILGSLTMTPSSSSSSASTSYGIEIGGTMYGNINLAGGTLAVQGNGSSNGIYILAANGNTPAGVLNGDINIDGTLAMTPVSTTSTTASSNTAIYVAGTLNGNINIATGGVVSSVGEGAQGIVITGSLPGNACLPGATFCGAIDNQGTLETLGTTSPTGSTGNPQGGIALAVEGNVAGGIFNDGPIGGNTTQNAIISSLGGAETIDITPASGATAGITIGGYTDSGDTASLLNRGTIEAGSENADVSTEAIIIGGTTTSISTTLTDGILNSGTITAAATNDSHQTGSINAIAILVNNYATIGGSGFDALNNTNENTNKPGEISASVSGSGTFGGEAIAININSNANFPSIVNSGSIVASATTTDASLANGALKAFAIIDNSGTLSSIINNPGAFIEAITTTLKDNSQERIAIDVAAAKQAVTITNQGTILGDIYLGSLNDSLSVSGVSATQLGSIVGNIYFGGTSGGADDQLNIGANGTVTGQIYAGPINNPTAGEVDIAIANGGTLNLLTAASETTPTSPPNLVEGTTFEAGSFTIDGRSFADIHYGQAFNTDFFPTAVIINAKNFAEFTDGATVTFTPDSFITPPLGVPSAKFVVFESPAIYISATEFTEINTKFDSTLSYLYDPLDSGLSRANNGGLEELVLTITPKTIGSDGCKTQAELNNCNLAHIPLFGYAAQLFPYANIALGNDNALGAAVINGVTNSYNAQQTYEDFAPDVSGAIRADAISLTDSATNVVAARQRALRQYANQEGDLTLWGQQFAQRLNQDSTTAGAGYTDTGFGFAVGADEGDPVDGRYGVDFTFFSGDTSEKQPRLTKTTSEWYILGGYTDWRGRGLFLDTQLNLGYVSMIGNRYMQLEEPTNAGTFTLFQRDAYDQRAGEFGSLGATTGAVFDEGGTVFTPQVSVDGLAMRQEAYNESGGGNGFDLHVASSYDQSLRGFAGLGVRQDFDFTDFLIQPNILAGYRYDFANGAESLKANFESVSPASVFEVTGPKPDKGNIVASGGFTVATGAWSLGLSFDYLKAGSGNTSEEGTITLLGRI